MFSLVRKVVAGPKITTRYQGEDLDLTYITDRVIAMAFPASDLIEKTYRNNIEDVSAYLEEHHFNNFLVINVSSRDYDYSAFNDQVRSYEWPDHQTPPFTTLIKVAYDMYKFLKTKPFSVVAVHCNHGKGRTGTAIISLMLLISLFKSAVECLKFYNGKRFNKKTYGVDQPCQLRYLKYIQEILERPKIDRKLICYRLKGITHRGLDQDHYLNISFTRNQELVYEKVRFTNHRLKENGKLLISDILLELFYENWSGKKKVARINYNLFFLNGGTKLRFKGDNIKVQSGHTKEFEFILHFQYYCLCHLQAYQESVCSCRQQRIIEQKFWDEMIGRVNQCKKMTKNQAVELLYNPIQRQSKKMRRLSNEMEQNNKRLTQSMGYKKFKNSHQQKIYTYYQNCSQKKMFDRDEISFEEEQVQKPLRKISSAHQRQELESQRNSHESQNCSIKQATNNVLDSKCPTEQIQQVSPFSQQEQLE